MGNNDVRTTSIAANVILSGEFTGVSFLKNHLSIKVVLWVVKHFKNTVDVVYKCLDNAIQLHQF
jgi:hypothetical protein